MKGLKLKSSIEISLKGYMYNHTDRSRTYKSLNRTIVLENMQDSNWFIVNTVSPLPRKVVIRTLLAWAALCQHKSQQLPIASLHVRNLEVIWHDNWQPFQFAHSAPLSAPCFVEMRCAVTMFCCLFLVALLCSAFYRFEFGTEVERTPGISSGSSPTGTHAGVDPLSVAPSVCASLTFKFKV